MCMNLTVLIRLLYRMDDNQYSSSCLKNPENGLKGTREGLRCIFAMPYPFVLNNKIEALGECRPPWPRQIITPIFPKCNNVEPWWWKANPKGVGSLHATTIMVLFLLIHSSQNTQITTKNLISSSLYYPGPLHKILSQSVHNFLSNVVHRQTNRQTDKPTLPKT